MKDKTITARIGGAFSKEIEKIKQERLNRKIDKKKKSTKRLTNLIVEHNAWAKIREDTIEINLEEEKK